MKTPFNQWHLLFIVILVGGSGWLWVSRLPATAGLGNLGAEAMVGRPAPNFTLSTLTGERFELEALRGTPVVLNFWATWCGPCRAELPALQATAQQFAGQVQIIAVDQEEAADVVQAYVDELGLTFTIPMDSEGTVGKTYNILGLPTTYFIDRNGIIRQIWSGEMNRITLAESIAELDVY